MWTTFWDMNSGGGQKEDYNLIFIEAPMDEAKVIFYNRFGHNPDRVSCTCCGGDYSIDEDETLEQATAFHRGCRFEDDPSEQGGGHYVEGPVEEGPFSRDYIPLDQYVANAGTPETEGMWGKSALFIFADDINPEERIGSLPEQGYVWVGG